MKVRSQLPLFGSGVNDNTDRAPLTVWIDPDEPDADNFAGGGGAWLGIKQAYRDLGLERRAPGIAVNHWPEALAMYSVNHPECRIYCEDIHAVDPVKASGGRRYALAHFSPTCIFFSQARGGALDVDEATEVRGLAGIAVNWARSAARPRVTTLENVPQFEHWGPLHRTHSNGCSVEFAAANGKIDRKGKRTPKCRKGCPHGRPIKARRGEFFRAFVADLRGCYRYVSWRCLKACDYGAPTSRVRFFLIASDTPAVWPEPTHGPGRDKPWHTAAECIDWTIECPSIFERPRGLADKTLARIRAGIERFVFGAARPFIVHVTHGAREHDVDAPTPTVTCANRGELGVVSPLVMKAKTYGGGGNEATAANVPLGTITTSKRGEHAVATPVVVRYNGQRDGEARGQRPDEPLSTIDTARRLAIATPYLVHRSNGERAATETTKAQEPRVYDARRPLGTVVGTQKHALAMPVLVKNYSEREGGFAGGQRMNAPIGTITQRDHHSIAMLNLLKLRGTSDAHVNASAHAVDEPLDTISASGTHFAATAAYLIRYNGTSGPESLGKPLSTIDTRDRFALVTLTMESEVSERAMRVARFLGYDAPIVLEIDGVQWILVDIGFRMLVARELFSCQGFPDWSTVLTGEGWLAPTTHAAGDRGFTLSARGPAQHAMPNSSGHSVEQPSASPVVVDALIDLGRNVLELRSREKYPSSASSVAPLVSFPLPIEIVASARTLAPGSSCVDQTTETGRAVTLPSEPASTTRQSGPRCVVRFADETTDGVDGAKNAFSTTQETQDTPCITSPDGQNLPSFGSTRAILFSFVATAIAGSTLAQTLPVSSFDVELEIRERYQIDLVFRGKPLTKTAQIKCVGNSVPPQLARAVGMAAIRTIEYARAA